MKIENEQIEKERKIQYDELKNKFKEIEDELKKTFEEEIQKHEDQHKQRTYNFNSAL